MGDWLKNYGISEISDPKKKKNSRAPEKKTTGKKKSEKKQNKKYAVSGGKALVVHEDNKGSYVKRKVSGKLKPIRVKNTYNSKEEAQERIRKPRRRTSGSRKLGPKRK